MRKTITVVSMTALCLAGSVALQAQEPSKGGLAKYLQIYREEVKPGKGGAHEKIETGWPVALGKAGSKGHYLALTTTGMAWFVTPWETMAAAEQDEKAVNASAGAMAELERLSAADGEVLSKHSSLWAQHVPELDYHADWDPAKMRYVMVTMVRVKPGYGQEYQSIRKMVHEAHEKAKVDEKWAIYQVMTGAPQGTYLIFAPVASMAEIDRGDDLHGKAYQDTLGEDGRARAREFQREGLQGAETTLFSISPKMSYVPKALADRDPDFWSPKPAAPAKKP
jgi:hypothetical protein